MDKIYKRIENYLHKNFPNKVLVRCKEIVSNNFEIYGINTMQIKVYETESELYWELVTKN